MIEIPRSNQRETTAVGIAAASPVVDGEIVPSEEVAPPPETVRQRRRDRILSERRWSGFDAASCLCIGILQAGTVILALSAILLVLAREV